MKELNEYRKGVALAATPKTAKDALSLAEECWVLGGDERAEQLLQQVNDKSLAGDVLLLRAMMLSTRGGTPPEVQELLTQAEAHGNPVAKLYNCLRAKEVQTDQLPAMAKEMPDWYLAQYCALFTPVEEYLGPAPTAQEADKMLQQAERDAAAAIKARKDKAKRKAAEEKKRREEAEAEKARRRKRKLLCNVTCAAAIAVEVLLLYLMWTSDGGFSFSKLFSWSYGFISAVFTIMMGIYSWKLFEWYSDKPWRYLEDTTSRVSDVLTKLFIQIIAFYFIFYFADTADEKLVVATVAGLAAALSMYVGDYCEEEKSSGNIARLWETLVFLISFFGVRFICVDIIGVDTLAFSFNYICICICVCVVLGIIVYQINNSASERNRMLLCTVTCAAAIAVELLLFYLMWISDGGFSFSKLFSWSYGFISAVFTIIMVTYSWKLIERCPKHPWWCLEDTTALVLNVLTKLMILIIAFYFIFYFADTADEKLVVATVAVLAAALSMYVGYYCEEVKDSVNIARLWETLVFLISFFGVRLICVDMDIIEVDSWAFICKLFWGFFGLPIGMWFVAYLNDFK